MISYHTVSWSLLDTRRNGGLFLHTPRHGERARARAGAPPRARARARADPPRPGNDRARPGPARPAGTAPGEVWIDAIDHPSIGFVRTPEGEYLAGDVAWNRPIQH